MKCTEKMSKRLKRFFSAAWDDAIVKEGGIRHRLPPMVVMTDFTEQIDSKR